jgi:hypothetical protein
MWYNLHNALELQKFKERVSELQDKGAVVELTEKKPRSLQSNKYLHLMLSSFGLQFGYTLEEVKLHFYKLVANKDVFLRKGTDRFSGEVYAYLRSSSDLSQDEMSRSIENFRSWAKEEAGFDFPSSDEYIALLHIQHDVENQTKRYLGG